MAHRKPTAADGPRRDPHGVAAHRRSRVRTAFATAWLASALTSAPAVAAPAAEDLAQRSELATSVTSWQRLAVNALLVPLLKHEGRPGWAAPHEMQPCVGSAVRVDGLPIVPGRSLPLGRPIVVAYRLADCWPLGRDWIGLDGTLEMMVVNKGPSLIVLVRPLALNAAIAGARTPLRDDFVSVVSLAPARVRP